MNADEINTQLHHFLNQLSRGTLQFHKAYPRVIKFWEWNFGHYLIKQKFNPQKKRKRRKWLKIKHLITRVPPKIIINASCGNIREFMEFLEENVPSSIIKDKTIVNFDVVPAAIEHANKILQNKGWSLVSSKNHLFIWKHPTIEHFNVINTLGDANVLLTSLNDQNLVKLFKQSGLMWLDGIGNVIPVDVNQQFMEFNQKWLYYLNFLKIFNYFKWTHVTWLYLSEDGQSLISKLKFYKNVLWKSAPTIFDEISVVILDGPTRLDTRRVLERFPLEQLDETTLVGLKHEMQTIYPLSSTTVEVHDSHGTLSYIAHLVSPQYLARQFNNMIEKKVNSYLDELVYPKIKVLLDDRHFIKTFYSQTWQETS